MGYRTIYDNHALSHIDLMPDSPHNLDALVPISGRQLAAVAAPPGHVPTLFFRSESAAKRFWEFFTANIRNRNTRRAYFIAASKFSAWCEKRKLTLEQVEPIHVAAYIEQLGTEHAKPTVKQHLAAIRMLFDSPQRSFFRR